MLTLNVGNIRNFPKEEMDKLQMLIDSYDYHWAKNQKKNKYYEGNITLGSVNLGIALPEGMSGLEIGCAWGAKTVDVLAGRSMFDGFVGANGAEVDQLSAMSLNNNLLIEYSKACRDELKFGCTFATLSADEKIGCKVRFHSPQTASALWDGVKGRISCGMAIIDSVKTNDNLGNLTWEPSLIYYYTDDYVFVIRKVRDNIWESEAKPHKMGRPLMVPLIWNATSNKPFGRSRIKEPIRRLIDGYVRTIANATIGLEFATAPQKYLLGITDEQYDAIINQKFKQYVGNIIAGTPNPETGTTPTFGQLPQGNIAPHVEMIRILATQFSAATGLSVTDTGVVNDANPTSSDAILAQSQTLVGMAEQLNAGNGDALRTIGQMMLAIANDTSLDGLSDNQKDIIAHFKNPAMPSVAMTADAAIKIASVRPEFASTDVYLEMVGFDQAEIRRIKAQETRARGLQILQNMNFGGNADADNRGGMEEV